MKIRKMHVTGQDFPNYSSSEGAPSDCSVEAWPTHSEVEEDVEHEENLQLVGLELGPRTSRIAHGLGSPQAS